MAEKEITLSDVEEEIITKAFARNTQYFIFFSGLSLVSLLSVGAALRWAPLGTRENYILPDN